MLRAWLSKKAPAQFFTRFRANLPIAHELSHATPALVSIGDGPSPLLHGVNVSLRKLSSWRPFAAIGFVGELVPHEAKQLNHQPLRLKCCRLILDLDPVYADLVSAVLGKYVLVVRVSMLAEISSPVAAALANVEWTPIGP